MTDDTGLSPSGPVFPDPVRLLGRLLQGTILLTGIVIIFLGLWYALSVLTDVFRYLHDPASIEPLILANAKLLGLEKAELKFAAGDALPIGRTAGFLGLIFWELLAGYLSLAFIRTGSRLVLAVINERREFAQAMREFLVTVRHEGIAGAKSEQAPLR